MKIGIVVAMEEEINPLQKRLEKWAKEMGFENEKTLGFYIEKSGIGKINAAITTTKLIINKDVDFIINCGVAGGLKNDIKIGDVIVANYIKDFDFDLSIFGYSTGQIPECPEKFETDLVSGFPELKRGMIISTARFATKKDLVRVKKIFGDAFAIDMEVSGIAQTCFKFNIPFWSIKIISDNLAENENKETYKNQLNSNCEKLSKLVFEIIKQKFTWRLKNNTL